MYHSITFQTKRGNSIITRNTYYDWGLVPDGRPTIALPEVNTNSVEVPGMSGTLDLSEYLTGFPTYKNRTGSINFIVLPEIYSDWISRYNNIATFLHGKRVSMILEDDPEYVYTGRFKVTWTSNNDGSGSSVTIDYELEPFKSYINCFSLTKSINSSSFSDFVGSGDLSAALRIKGNATPVVPRIKVNSRSSSSIDIYCINDELGISQSNSSHSITNTTQKLKYYDCLLSCFGVTNNPKIMMRGTGSVLLEVDLYAF